MGKPVAPKKEQ